MNITLEQTELETLCNGHPTSVNTAAGEVFLISKEALRESNLTGLVETLYLMSYSGTYNDIVSGMKTPHSDCIKESEVVW